MKFTPTSKFLAIAKSSYKVISKKIYFCKTSVLTTALDSGTWIDATRFIDSIPDTEASIEYELGVFKCDSMKLTGKNITWLLANIFNASSSEYIECKVELLFGFTSADMATDIVYHFSGYVEKSSVFPTEETDKIAFTVNSADALMSKIDAVSIVAQYYEPVQAAIALINIPGVYVSDCNVSSYVVIPGIHSIAYDYNNGVPQARFNNGMWVNVSGGGSFSLGDGETTALDRQRVTVKVVTGELQTNPATYEENIIITASGTTLPSTWHTGISARALIKKFYTAIGITSQTFGTLTCNSFDGTTKKISFFENVNDGQSTSNMGYAYGIAYKNTTTVFVSSGNRVYSFNPTTGGSTYLFSVTAGNVISKLMYNSRNDHLWILFGNNILNTYGEKLARYVVSTATLSATITATGAQHFDTELFDVQHFGGGGYEYAVIFPQSDTRSIQRVDGSTLAVTTLFANTALGYTGSNGAVTGFAYQTTSGTDVVFRFFTDDTGVSKIHEIGFDTSAGSTWADNGIINAAAPFSHNIGAYIASETKVYGVDIGTNIIKKYTYNSGSSISIQDLGSDDVVDGMFSDATYVFYTGRKLRYLHYINAGGVNTASDVNMRVCYAGYTTGNSRVYGVDVFGRIFQFSTVIELHVDRCIFNDKQLKNAMTDTLRATNCVSTMSFAKTALTYPRGDASGAPVTSGNTVALSVTNTKDIEKDEQYGAAYDVVEVNTGDTSINYDGTNYNVLVNTLSQRPLTIENTMIPAHVAKDYCKVFFEYFNTARVLYTFPVLQAYHHIEPMDGASPTFTTTKITVSGTGKPIYSVKYSTDGKMKIGVLI